LKKEIENKESNEDKIKLLERLNAEMSNKLTEWEGNYGNLERDKKKAQTEQQDLATQVEELNKKIG